MTTGYTRSPKLLKGALIQFQSQMLIPVPNIIVFQYNPETMTRTLVPWKPREQVVYKDDAEAAQGRLKLLNELVQPFDPDETFTISLESTRRMILATTDQSGCRSGWRCRSNRRARDVVLSARRT